jgi:hypothetical protein
MQRLAMAPKQWLQNLPSGSGQGGLAILTQAITSAHPQMANLPDIGVARKILSSEYPPYACG